MQMAGLQRLSRALPEHLDTILQELENANGRSLWGPDSAESAFEKEDSSDQESYQLTRNRVCTRPPPEADHSL